MQLEITITVTLYLIQLLRVQYSISRLFITTLNLPVEMMSVKVVEYIFQGNQVNGEAGILTQFFLTSGFCIFFIISGKNILMS